MPFRVPFKRASKSRMYMQFEEGSMFQKVKTLIAAFVILSFLGGAVPARAVVRDDDRKCEERIRNA